MKFTLRQARSLETRLKGLTIANQVIMVRSYDGDVAREDILKGAEDLIDEIDIKLDINEIRHLIKSLINKANMECGVSTLLNRRDSLYSKLALLDSVGPPDSLDRQIKYIKESSTPTHLACVLSEEQHSKVRSLDEEAREHLRQTAIELAELNSTVCIELDDEDVEILKVYKAI